MVNTTDDYSRILDQLTDALIGSAGYQPGAVVRNYAFADYLGANQEVRHVQLAAFAEIPPSYRSACVAVAQVREDRELRAAVKDLKALGAPRVITISPSRARVWMLPARGEPEQIEEHRSDEIARIIRTSPVDWSPRTMSRLGGIAVPGPYQLDFADLGLIPMIERQVNEKLDRLIQEILAGSLDLDQSLTRSHRRYRQLVRMIFQLLAAKVLADREHPSVDRPLEDSTDALEAAQRHYGVEAHPAGYRGMIPVATLDWVWDKIRQGFHFQNLSVDSLAFVYENSLVSPQIRRRLGIHGTPRGLAELVVGLLPLDELPEGRQVILEPCSGFAPFLLAAMRRLRSLTLRGLDPTERHLQMVRRLRGVELDAFALEVGRLCLTLADYPNADGWELVQADVFDHGVLENQASGVGAVLANPPFEAFQPEERSRYEALRATKPAELLERILRICSPHLIGFVVPRVLITSDRTTYRQLRTSLRQTFREIDVIEVPDTIFEYSEAESALLIARSRREGGVTTLRSARIRPTEREAVVEGSWIPNWSTATPETDSDPASPLRIPSIKEVWDYLSHLPTLDKVARIHRGIEYKDPFSDVQGGVISMTPQSNFALGIHSGQDLKPYRICREVYLNINPKEIRRAAKHPWFEPKVIVNAARRRRGLWPLTAAPDEQGRWCYQNLFGVWPVGDEPWWIPVITAILNSPVANAFAAMKSGKRGIHRETLARIPVPDFSLLDQPLLLDLVHQAGTALDLEILLRIDAEILRGFGLPPRLERRLLRLFDDESRPGVPTFTSYYPSDFDSALPLHRILSDVGRMSRAKELLATTPVFKDRSVTEVLDEIAAGFEA